MRHLRTTSLVGRLLVAAFALWLPAATGQGGKATCVAAASLAKTMSEAGKRPHLSCHGEKGAKKSCCCRGMETLRAAACGCHDGDKAFGTAAHDPMLVSWTPATAARTFAGRTIPATRLPVDRFHDAPDPPPPRIPPFLHA